MKINPKLNCNKASSAFPFVIITFTILLGICLPLSGGKKKVYVWLCFHQDRFDQLKSEKSGSSVKTACPKLSELKMQAVFT